MSNELADWFNGIPLLTRYWFGGTIVLSLLGRIGLVSGMYMVLFSELVLKHFQIWRPVTALFYFPITPQTGFNFLLNLYFLYSYSTRLETGLFDGRRADYAFLLLFNWGCLVMLGLFVVDLLLLMNSMVMSIMYIWCQVNKDTIVSFWFGTQFKAMYMPWVVLLFRLILNGQWVGELLGILVGHLYFFMMFKYPQDFGGRSLLSTPQFLYKWFPNRRGGTAGFGQAPASRRQDDNDDRGPHRWGGGGQRLGGN